MTCLWSNPALALTYHLLFKPNFSLFTQHQSRLRADGGIGCQTVMFDVRMANVKVEVIEHRR